MTPALIYSDDLSDVWHGDCLDDETLEHERFASFGCLIADAPYSERTHRGHASGRLSAEQLARYAARKTSRSRTREAAYAARKGRSGEHRRDIDYPSWSPADVERFVGSWAPRIDGWIVSMTDHVLTPHWLSALEVNNRCVFSPLSFVEQGSRVRMTGDGPAQWSCMVVVGRPRSCEYASWGALPGAYVVPGERTINSSRGSLRVVGGKPLSGMIQIVRDYSRPEQTIVDPCCGSGTTLAAAKSMGRRSVGIDSSLEHCELAAERLRRTTYQPALAIERRVNTVEGSLVLPGVDT